MNKTPGVLWIALYIVGLGLVLGGCSKNNLSERDSRLEQLRNQAEIKRKELQTIVGIYEGIIDVSENERDLYFDLHLIDIPQYVEGEVDPVMVPMISGHMNLDKPPEHTPFGVLHEKSSYDKKENNLALTLENDAYGILHIRATLLEEELSATLSWPKFGIKEIPFKVQRLSDGGGE